MNLHKKILEHLEDLKGLKVTQAKPKRVAIDCSSPNADKLRFEFHLMGIEVDCIADA